MTVGLIDWENSYRKQITENDLRKQLGMDTRKWY